jgi:hypothetical protein
MISKLENHGAKNQQLLPMNRVNVSMKGKQILIQVVDKEGIAVYPDQEVFGGL